MAFLPTPLDAAEYPPPPAPSTPRTRRAVALACLAAALVSIAVLFDLGRLDLWDPDEANYAEIAREMNLSGDWLVPHSNFRPYLEKPPLAFWGAALALRLVADPETAARLPAAAAGLILLFAAALWARRTLPAGGALAAVLVLGTSSGFLICARLGILDLPLTACISVSLFGFERCVLAGGGRGGWFLFYAGMAAGCLVKGPIAAVLPALCAGLAAAWVRPPHFWRRLDPVRGALLFLALAAPWYAAVELRSPGFLRGFLLDHHLLRFAGDGIEHRHPLPRWAYAPLVILAAIPWIVAGPGALTSASRRIRAGDPRATLLVVWALLPVILFALSSTRLAQYALPSVPPLGLLVAWHVAEHRWRPALLFLLALAGVGLHAGFERGLGTGLNERRSLRALAQEASRRAADGEPILSYRLGKPFASVFYSGRRVRFLEEEVTFDQFVASPRRLWILIDEGERSRLEQRHRRPFRPALEQGGRSLITNRPVPQGNPEP